MRVSSNTTILAHPTQLHTQPNFTPKPSHNLQADAIKAAKLRLFVRRGGPNYQTGLAAMRAVGEELGIPVEVGLGWVGAGLGWVFGGPISTVFPTADAQPTPN